MPNRPPEPPVTRERTDAFIEAHGWMRHSRKPHERYAYRALVALREEAAWLTTENATLRNVEKEQRRWTSKVSK